MVVIRGCSVLVLLMAVAVVYAAAPPPALPLAKWIEDLGSDDDTVRDRAADNLWKSGERALPALRDAKKHTDPDVVLRSSLIVARLEWGIRPETPDAVVKLIEQFRDGTAEQKTAAIEQLVKEGRAGYIAMSFLLPRAGSEELRKQMAARLEKLARVAARDMIARGQMDECEQLLRTAAASGEVTAILDLAVFLVLTGKADRAREMEAKSPKVAAYVCRAAGDMKSARRVAEKAGDPELLIGILDEMEDYKALVNLEPANLKKHPDRWASLLHRAGVEDAIKGSEEEAAASRAIFYFLNDRPRQGIASEIEAGNPYHACILLIAQGRHREALELTAPANKAEMANWILCEQTMLLHRLGEKERVKEYFEKAIKSSEHALSNQQGAYTDAPLRELLKTGRRTERVDEAVKEVGRLLDKAKEGMIPHGLLSEMSSSEAHLVQLWWTYLARQTEGAPSKRLALLADWFIKGKADDQFDERIAAARRDRKFTPEEQDRWPLALAFACTAVGKRELAIEVLKEVLEKSGEAKPGPWYAEYARRLGALHFAQQKWTEAAAAYEQALKPDSTAVVPLYLRGVALVKSGKEAEGKALIKRAMLLPLADEAMRYALAEELTKLGLLTEASAVRLMLHRACPFHSIYQTNVASALGAQAALQGKHLEAARLFRRVFTNFAFTRAGAFIDHRAYLLLPARAHLNQARGLAEAGKLEEALASSRVLWEYLPEEVAGVPDLVRAYEKADRKADADKLFDEVFTRLAKGCEETPNAIDRLNRIAWMAARCGRKLDEAIAHARKATKLRPTAGLFDTLAESHFQRGDKDDAIAAIKEAIRLDPKRKYFAAQLARIEKGDKAAPLPAEER